MGGQTVPAARGRRGRGRAAPAARRDGPRGDSTSRQAPHAASTQKCRRGPSCRFPSSVSPPRPRRGGPALVAVVASSFAAAAAAASAAAAAAAAAATIVGTIAAITWSSSSRSLVDFFLRQRSSNVIVVNDGDDDGGRSADGGDSAAGSAARPRRSWPRPTIPPRRGDGREKGGKGGGCSSSRPHTDAAPRAPLSSAHTPLGDCWVDAGLSPGRGSWDEKGGGGG